jgi:hypothetical protein
MLYRWGLNESKQCCCDRTDIVMQVSCVRGYVMACRCNLFWESGIFRGVSWRRCRQRPAVGMLSVDWFWNVMAHAQKPDFVFRRNGRVRLNRRGRQFSRLLAAEVCASAVVMLDTPCSEVVWRILAIHSVHQFPLRFPSRASCAITFQLDSTAWFECNK